MSRIAIIFLVIFFTFSCGSRNAKSDASGTFEAIDVVVSSEISGRILALKLEEGQTLEAGAVVGEVDATNINLQKEQIQASIRALKEKTADVNPQVRLLEDQLAVQQSQIKTLQRERTRTENLLKADAATPKQLDDINAQFEVLQKQAEVTRQQINVQKSQIQTQNRGILSEEEPMEKRVEQLDDKLKKARITNPVKGTVITKYAEAGEMTTAGKPLYKIADLSELTLRAYITGSQLSQVKLGQVVTVRVDQGQEEYRELNGRITWISDKAEFTPKTIQTKDERANLVYAMKVRVKNNGYLKIGMYGEILLNRE
ncbi:MAG TPA: HlyD family efflux transporter periplasmic adaptor subunit [Sphingobacteriaceae bacterium]